MPNKKRIARHQFKRSGWNADNDPEWRYRKTLTKEERDTFDMQEGMEKILIVSEWMKAGEPREHNYKVPS